MRFGMKRPTALQDSFSERQNGVVTAFPDKYEVTPTFDANGPQRGFCRFTAR